MAKLTFGTILEQVTESIKLTRRWGLQGAPKFPTAFDLGKVTWNEQERKIKLDLVDGNVVRHFDLMLVEVLERKEDDDDSELNGNENGNVY